MTIVKDIADGVRNAELRPIGLLLGCSGWHAYAADSEQIMRDCAKDHPDWADLRLVRALAFSRTDDFLGWDLLIGKNPNPHRSDRGRAAA
jgi:hypothetical protein